MNSFYEYFAAQHKIAAFRQAKRLQRGVRLGENQSVTSSATVKFVSNPITIGTDDFSVEFYGTIYGQNSSYASLFNAASPSAGGDKTFSFYSQHYPNNGIYGVLFSPDTEGNSLGDQVVVQYEQGDDSKFLVSVTRQDTTVKVYINGELKATKEQSEVKDLGDLQLAIANSSDVGFVRVWNYALSADDVTAHYNNGDPMGYVVPKAMRRPEIAFPSGIYTESSMTFTQNNTQNTTATYNNPQANGFSGSYMRFDAVTTVSLYNAFWSNILKRAYPIKMTIEYRCNYDLYEGNTVQVSGRMLVTANDGDAKVVAIYYPNSLGNANLGIGNNNAPDAWLEIRVTSIESVGLLAEYLPQNLMYGRDDKKIATSWLDSAKQLPLSDEYMEPLFQSIGGYDMAANGAPEIIYNE